MLLKIEDGSLVTSTKLLNSLLPQIPNFEKTIEAAG
jgi:hypothetical protein